MKKNVQKLLYSKKITSWRSVKITYFIHYRLNAEIADLTMSKDSLAQDYQEKLEEASALRAQMSTETNEQ